MKRLLLFLLFSSATYAQGNYTAATGNQADVQSCINGTSCSGGSHTAHDGDIINIPAGSWAWTGAGVSVPSNFAMTIIGSGTPNSTPSTTGASASCASGTTITMSGTMTGFAASPAFGSSLMRLSCMNITYGSGAVKGFTILGHCSVGPPADCTKLRIDNMTFTSWAGHTNAGISAGIGAVGDMFGVADHNTIVGRTTNLANPGPFLHFIEFSHAHFLDPTTQYGDNSWFKSENYGSLQALFFENNHLTNAGLSESEGSAGSLTEEGGGRIVGRFNTLDGYDVSNFSFGWHGTESNGRPRSPRTFEFYKNNWSCASGIGCLSIGGARGGTGMIWGNTISLPGAGASTNFYTLSTYRTQGNPGGSYGACDGQSVYDGDDPNNSTYPQNLTIQSISGNVITVTPTQTWTNNQWTAAGAPYSIHDTQSNSGTEISANGASTLTIILGSGPSPYTPTAGHTIQISRAFWCLDQAAGRGTSNVLYSGTTPTPLQTAGESLVPTYVWLDSYPKRANFGSIPIVSNTGTRVIALRDFYSENYNQAANPTSGFDGTITTACGTTLAGSYSGACGIGHGPKANRPATCTTGVFYWATDEGNWNSTVAANTSGNGYTCTSTNTWSLTYTPAPYPHHLIGSVFMTPEGNNFGTITVGSSSSPLTITVTNGSNNTAGSVTPSVSGGNPGDFTITNSGAGSCAVAGVTLAVGANCTFTVTFTPTASGARSTTLSVTYTGGDGLSPISAALTGTGGGGTGASLTPASIAFPNTAVGFSSTPAVATLTNTGAVSLTVSSISILGNGFSQTNNCPGSLAVGASCLITVFFQPTNFISFNATLSVVSSAPSSPNTIPLSGLGIAVAPTQGILFGR